MDFYADQGAFLASFFFRHQPPEFVKAAGYDTDYSVMEVPATSFADPHRRLFPCHTAADTWVSAVYYHGKQAAADPAVELNLRRFARIWGVEDAVDAARQQAQAYRQDRHSKTAAVTTEPTDWRVESPAGTWDGEGSASLQKAAAVFLTKANRFGLAVTGEIAAGFAKEAARLQVDLPVDVARLAGQTAPDGLGAKVALAKRAGFLHERGDQQAMARTLADFDVEGFDVEQAHKVAAYLDEFDRQHGFERCWGRELVDPLRSVFGPESVQAKTAASVDEREVRVGSKLVKVAAFDEELGRMALGEDFTRERLLNLSAEEAGRLAQYL